MALLPKKKKINSSTCVEFIMKKLVVILVLVLFQLSSYGQEAQSSLCPKELNTLPILQNGRLKPLYIHVKETFSHLGTKLKGPLSSTQVYCLLSLEGLKVPNTLLLKTSIQHVELRKFLELSKEQKDISFKTLLEKYQDIRLQMVKIKE